MQPDNSVDPATAAKQMTIRDTLAVDRTILAHERTFLAYVQSFLAMIGAGLALIHLVASIWVQALGYALLPIGVLFLTVGIVKQRRRQRLMRRFRRHEMEWPD